MLRITELERNPEGQCVLRLEGRLVGPWVGLLRDIAEGGDRVVFDLSRLRFAGADGVELLRRLLDAGAELRDCPPFLRELLDSGSGRAGTG